MQVLYYFVLTEPHTCVSFCNMEHLFALSAIIQCYLCHNCCYKLPLQASKGMSNSLGVLHKMVMNIDYMSNNRIRIGRPSFLGFRISRYV